MCPVCNFGSIPGNQNWFLAKEDKARKAKLLLPRHDGRPALDFCGCGGLDKGKARKEDKEKAEVLYISRRVWCRISGNLFKTH